MYKTRYNKMVETRTSCRNSNFWTHTTKVLMMWTTVIVSFGESSMIAANIPESSLLTNFVQRIIQPYIQPLHVQSDNTSLLRSLDESPVQEAIREVIKDLKPYLQDEDNDKDDKVTPDGTAETIIIEILPRPHSNILRTAGEPQKESSDLQTSIHKYEKLKTEIKAALKRESVSEKTKNMVIRTLDDLIAQVIGNQCSWKSVDHTQSLTFRNGKNDKHDITLEEWKDLKNQYLTFLERNHLNKSMVLFNEFHNFFSKIINNTETLSKNYKVKCQLLKLGDGDKTTIVKETERAQDGCEDFILCSEELKEFLIDFYKSLNDTTASVFKNYAAMYEKDVITDGDDTKDIDSVPNILEHMSNAVDRRVTKVFLQELGKLKLDDNKNEEANIKILKEFVKGTCKRVHKHLKKHLESDLVALRARLLLSVKQDINMNLGVDLGNLEADIKERICTVLVTCNSRVSTNRRSSNASGRPRINPSSLYVKLQLNLDDRLKDAIEKTNKDIINLRRNMPKVSGFRNNYEKELKYDNFNVTRTTVEVQSTTENLNSNSRNINDILKNSVLEKF